MYSLYDIYNGIQTDITPIVGSISWNSSKDTLGQQLDFNIAYSDTKDFPKIPCDIGHLVVFTGDSGEIFRGIIVKENRKGRGSIQYTCFDYAFYLNKSKEIYQFNKVRADNAIKKMLNDFKVPIGNIAPMTTSITHIYSNQVISKIIQDILDKVKEETGVEYIMEMNKGKLCIDKLNKKVLKATFNVGGLKGDITDYISSPSRSRSIEKMKNSIKIISKNKNVKSKSSSEVKNKHTSNRVEVSQKTKVTVKGENEGFHVVANAKNQDLINKYGLLQEIKSVDEKDIPQAKNIASNMLKDLGKIFENNSIEVLGSDEVKSNRIIEFTEEVTGMKGTYLIKSDSHKLDNGIHTMQLSLEAINLNE